MASGTLGKHAIKVVDVESLIKWNHRESEKVYFQSSAFWNFSFDVSEK